MELVQNVLKKIFDELLTAHSKLILLNLLKYMSTHRDVFI